jgi:hypothetical protein
LIQVADDWLMINNEALFRINCFHCARSPSAPAGYLDTTCHKAAGSHLGKLDASLGNRSERTWASAIKKINSFD